MGWPGAYTRTADAPPQCLLDPYLGQTENLTRWLTFKQLHQARRTTLEAFFRAHNCHHPKLIEERLATVRNAAPLTEDPAIIRPKQLLVEGLVEQLRATLKRASSALMPRSPAWRRRYQTTNYSMHCLAQARRWRRVCSLPLVNSVIDTPVPPSSRCMQASLR